MDAGVKHREAVQAKYRSEGWDVMQMPADTINDFIARRRDRYHFVQVIPRGKEKDPKYEGIPLNSFVQNAFSNGAEPIHAHCHITRTENVKISFTDVNTNCRVIINKKPVKTAE